MPVPTWLTFIESLKLSNKFKNCVTKTNFREKILNIPQKRFADTLLHNNTILNHAFTPI